MTVYLTREAVLRTLAWVASLAAGSTIVFSYVAEPTDAEPVVRATHEAMAERAAALGEPWRTYFDPADLAGELARLGFVDVEDLGPDATCARYFADRSDGLRPGGAAHLVRASTPAR